MRRGEIIKTKEKCECGKYMYLDVEDFELDNFDRTIVYGTLFCKFCGNEEIYGGVL